MRKRVINHVADTIFWYVLYFLPVLAYLCFILNTSFKDIQVEEGSSVEYEVQRVCTAPAGTVLIFEAMPDFSEFTSYASLSAYSASETGAIESVFLSNCFLVDLALSLPYPISFAPYHVLYFDTSSSNPLQLPVDFSFIVPVDFVFESNFIFTSGNQTLYLPLNSCVFSTQYVSSEKPKPDLISYDFKAFVNELGFEFVTDNIIVNSLADIFGTGGIMPMFDNDTPFIIFAWFIGVYLLHLLVDFLLFIPRIAHKWMKDCTGGD